MSLKFLVKSLIKGIFFTDHLRHETLSKITCRALSANHRKLCAHQLKSFSTVMIIF